MKFHIFLLHARLIQEVGNGGPLQSVVFYCSKKHCRFYNPSILVFCFIIHSFQLINYVTLCFSLFFLTLVCPVSVVFSTSSFLIKCPDIFNCHFLIANIRSLVIHIFLEISSLFTLFFHARKCVYSSLESTFLLVHYFFFICGRDWSTSTAI